MTRAALATGLGALLFLSFSPKMGWVYVSTAAKTPGANPGVFPNLSELVIVTGYLNEPQAAGDFWIRSIKKPAWLPTGIDERPWFHRDDRFVSS